MWMKKQTKYFATHVHFNSLAHLVIGLGLGFLLARPLDGGHPVRVGLVILGVGLLMRLKPLLMK